MMIVFCIILGLIALFLIAAVILATCTDQRHCLLCRLIEWRQKRLPRAKVER